MNNKERYLWIGVLILACLFCDRKMSQIESLEYLNEHNKLSREIQSSQINEMTLELSSKNSIGYNKGFEDGKAYAMIATMHNENLHDYAEGYHAAINQLSEELSSGEIKGQVASYINGLMKDISKNNTNNTNGN